MTAQVVLQFPTSEDVDSYDKLIRFEEALISLLGESAKVDGHDFGAGEMNVFILTEDPIATFAVVQQTDRSIRPSQDMRAAFRPIDGEDYVCLWPPELMQFQLA
ncbi:ABC transporter [Granulicella paludicola]|uniref:ABC transporter n=1 Tax=Granulicella paludicola TaxID=474951 RepID=UPI0021E0CA9E|nr:ABC transporter [Granulicella paludicola]